MPSASSLVQLTRSEAALRVALATPALHPDAVGNPALPENLWLSAYPAKPKLPSAKLAKVLVERPLSTTQLDHVLAVETRPAVLTKAFQATKPTLAHLNALLGTKTLSEKLASEITDSFGDVVDLAWLKAAGDAVGGKARMEYFLRAGDEVSDAEISAALETYATWSAEWDTDRQHKLLAARPGVLAAATRSDSLKLRTSAAGCRFLTDPALQRQVADLDAPQASDPMTAPRAWLNDRSFVWVALVCNPACDLEVVKELEPLMAKVDDYESRYRASNRLAKQPFRVEGSFAEVTDHRVIAWLLRRTLPGQAKNAGRPYDLPALLENPHLSEGEVIEIAATVKDAAYFVAQPGIAEALHEFVDRWPTVITRHGLNHVLIDELVAEHRDYARGQAELERAQQTLDDLDLDPDKVAAAGELKVSGFDWLGPLEKERAAAYLAEHLGANDAAWFLAFRLLDEGGFAGTVADLAVVAEATS